LQFVCRWSFQLESLLAQACQTKLLRPPQAKRHGEKESISGFCCCLAFSSQSGSVEELGLKEERKRAEESQRVEILPLAISSFNPLSSFKFFH